MKVEDLNRYFVKDLRRLRVLHAHGFLHNSEFIVPKGSLIVFTTRIGCYAYAPFVPVSQAISGPIQYLRNVGDAVEGPNAHTLVYRAGDKVLDMHIEFHPKNSESGLYKFTPSKVKHVSLKELLPKKKALLSQIVRPNKIYIVVTCRTLSKKRQVQPKLLRSHLEAEPSHVLRKLSSGPLRTPVPVNNVEARFVPHAPNYRIKDSRPLNIQNKTWQRWRFANKRGIHEPILDSPPNGWILTRSKTSPYHHILKHAATNININIANGRFFPRIKNFLQSNAAGSAI